MVVGGNGVVRRTTNNGQNWSVRSSGVTNTLYDIVFTDANTATVVGANGTIIQTSNAGLNWTRRNTGLGNTLYGVSFADTANGLAVGESGIMLRTTDGGTTWAVAPSCTRQTLRSVVFIDINTATVVGDNGAILRMEASGIAPSAPALVSPANGATLVSLLPTLTWNAADSATTYRVQVASDPNFSSLVVDTSDVFTTSIDVVDRLAERTLHFWRVNATNNFGTSDWSSTWFFTTGTVAVAERNEDLPREFSLSQNYPNPFNPTTSIVYTLPQSAHVELKVFNALGHEVLVLVNEKKPAGSHALVVDASKLESGVYLYRLRAQSRLSGTFVATRKFVVMK
ncbi:T9SS type A sorting domain-containing protein [candidate division KSB1 bacterium]|nr:T9SS type A sorting domain-containing protein [candidate division KSB1 bacterium]